MLANGPQAGSLKARSSVGEHYLDTVGVSGSIPLVPTITMIHCHIEKKSLRLRRCFLRDSSAKQNDSFVLADVTQRDS